MMPTDVMVPLSWSTTLLLDTRPCSQAERRVDQVFVYVEFEMSTKQLTSCGLVWIWYNCRMDGGKVDKYLRS